MGKSVLSVHKNNLILMLPHITKEGIDFTCVLILHLHLNAPVINSLRTYLRVIQKVRKIHPLFTHFGHWLKAASREVRYPAFTISHGEVKSTPAAGQAPVARDNTQAKYCRS